MKRICCCLLALVVVAAACTDQTPVSPLSKPSSANRPSLSRIADLSDLVPTPAGWYHRDCVHEVPNGAHVDINNVVTLPDSSTYQIPMCAHPGRVAPPGPRPRQAGGSAPTDNGWIEYADYNPGTAWGEIDANWHVPAAPTGSYSTSQVYYTFPGIESSAYINQPVLTYGYATDYGGNYWSGASWHCNNGTDCKHGSVISLSPGDSVLGTVTASACTDGECTWTIVTNDVTKDTRSNYTITDTYDFSYAVGGAVEVYGLTSCSQFPANGVFYTDIALYDQSHDQVSPSWSNHVASGTDPNCSFNVTSTASTVNLYHNPPPPSLSVTIDGPGMVRPNTTCLWTSTVSGGTPPYSYEWDRSYVVVSTTDSYSGATGTYNFWLDLHVTDANGGHGSDHLNVSINSGAPLCPYVATSPF